MQNGFCESFNGRMRDELLNETPFFGLELSRDNQDDEAATIRMTQRRRRGDEGRA